MKSSAKAGAWAGIAACIMGGADTRANPYQIITARNAFALRPIPLETPRPVEEVPAPPSLEIKLTGVATLLGVPGAFLEFIDPRTKKADRPPLFREGDRYSDQITIVSIDAKNGWVKIRNNGVEATLDFERNGIKPASMPTVAAASGASQTSALAPSTPVSAGGRSIVGPAALPSPRPVAMTREEALAAIEKQRAIYQQQNHPALNILPPPGMGRSPAAIPDPRLR